ASTGSMGAVMIAAGGVAALGFLSLVFAGVPSIANFGLACAIGIASAVLLEMSFIPALRAVLPAPRRVPRHGGLTDRLLAALERRITARQGRGIMLTTAALVVLSIVGIARIRTYGPTREYMPETSLPRIHLDELEKHFPGTVTMTVLYEGDQGAAKS